MFRDHSRSSMVAALRGAIAVQGICDQNWPKKMENYQPNTENLSRNLAEKEGKFSRPQYQQESREPNVRQKSIWKSCLEISFGNLTQI